MAEEPPTTAPLDMQAVSRKNIYDATRSPPLTSAKPAAVSEPTTEPMETDGEAPISKEGEETAGKHATAEVKPPDEGDATEIADGPSSADPAENETAASNNMNGKRKSIGTVAEHKGKKLNKKKSMPTLHLDCKPGDFYWARLKGYPPWPAIVCDEQMLPESLLASRPVSTMRPDGSLRDDFKEGGKNAKERTFPIMFLSTNEL